MLDLSLAPVVVSDELVRRLTDLQLCRPRDFRRAKAGVRRLARDIPAFDSVWIDALVQLRKLTPYQARVLEEGSADHLRIGPYVIEDKLGHGPHGTTFLARMPGGRKQAVVKRLIVPAESMTGCRDRLQKLIDRTSGWSHPHVIVPDPLLNVDPAGLITVSRWIPGLTVSELLVRRGRFPATIVLEIARQLSVGLAALHGRGLAHGDIRLSNIRITDSGMAIAVDAGLRPTVCPELTIHEILALDAYDGVAPELIGTGIEPNASSEIYAFGCLLWQLLTGRPPYPMADPLMKLAAHQTQRIADVRAWAPDTPAALANLLLAMTSPDVNERPMSFDDILNRFGRPGMSSRSRIKRYRRTFDGAVPHFVQESPLVTASKWPWIAASLFVVAGAACSIADRGLRNELVTITQRTLQAVRSGSISGADDDLPDKPATNATATTLTENGLLPLPAPSTAGEIVLAEVGPYDVADVAVDGRLTIRGVGGITPVIRIRRDPLRLAATSVRLENVTLQIDESHSDSRAMATLLVRSQDLKIQDCGFERIPAPDAAPHRQGAVHCAWQPLDASAMAGDSTTDGHVEIENTLFRGQGTAVWLADSPTSLAVTNCLKLGAGACIAVSHKAASRSVPVSMKRMTLRNSGPLLRLSGVFAEQNDVPPIELTAEDCVFALSSGQALVELQTVQPRSDAKACVHMTGHGSVIAPSVPLIAWSSPTVDPGRPASVEEIADADEQFEGLIVCEFDFSGPESGDPNASQLSRSTAPRSSTASLPPGVISDKLQRH